MILFAESGAGEGIRTLDPNLGKEILDGGAGGRNRTGTLSPELDFEGPQMPYPLCIRGYPISR
jgi:hypothetical protein